MSGSPLDAMPAGRLKADLYFMTSTSVNFTYRVLDKFVAAMARSAKIVIFNEPWWPGALSPNIFRIPRPEQIDPERPLLGVRYLNCQNNYPHYLEKHGFAVRSSRIE